MKGTEGVLSARGTLVYRYVRVLLSFKINAAATVQPAAAAAASVGLLAQHCCAALGD
jgi:hypothetical protein